MKRIALVALIITFVTVGAFSESKSVKALAKQQDVSQTGLAPIPLSAMFPAASDDTRTVTDAKGMVMMDAPNHEVVMVRINTDGSRSHACVNDETAARAFLSGQKSSATRATREK
ncbi:MAG: hypothetical protein M3P29_11815 [Acidobacteriota bacterium]|nr:hypothetical protein [Acidobacteriota bacterium]